MVRLPSPVESWVDSALVRLQLGFLDRLILLSPLCAPSHQARFLLLLYFLEITPPHKEEAAVLLLHLKIILHETVLNSDAASTHFDPCIQGHLVIFMVFSP